MQTKRMRDGIYKVDFQSEKDAGKGIAMVRSGNFTGTNKTHVYFGKIEGQGGELNATLSMLMYESAATGMPEAHGKKSAPLLRLNVEGLDGRFVLSGASDAESKSRYELKAEWVAEL
jgi:hypothetical protein